MGLGGGNMFGILALLGRFGWKGILIGAVVIGFLMFGGGASMCSGLGGGGGGPSQGGGGGLTQTGEQTEDTQVKFVGFVFDDVQKSWQGQLRGYQNANIVVFRGAVASACGTTSSAVGPFYCPLDNKVYIDLSFYQELSRRFGAPGDFAQAYVIAHEIGHHIQNQRGLLRSAERDGEASIRTELQADCLAGVWARDAERRNLVEVGDVEEALGAAAAIGDDTLQKKTQGRIQPETWTHGSSEQRVAAFKKGYNSGDGAACGL